MCAPAHAAVRPRQDFLVQLLVGLRMTKPFVDNSDFQAGNRPGLRVVVRFGGICRCSILSTPARTSSNEALSATFA
jgi:hypothetical protein